MEQHSRRIEGKTPNGGAYAIIYFMDENGAPTTEEKSVSCEIHEFDEKGNIIFRTYSAPRKI